MKRTDIPLWLAIHKVFPEFEAEGKFPRADKWQREGPARLEVCSRVLAAMAHTVSWQEQILKKWASYKRDGEKSPTPILCERLLVDGSVCFWYGRGKGECSDELDMAHVISDSKGGDKNFANSIIECSHHNRSRGTKTIEEYLAAP